MIPPSVAALSVPTWGRAAAANQSLLNGPTCCPQPKDDRKHRAAWRELYTPAELAELANLAAHCRRRGVRMLYGIGGFVSEDLTINHCHCE